MPRKPASSPSDTSHQSSLFEGLDGASQAADAETVLDQLEAMEEKPHWLTVSEVTNRLKAIIGDDEILGHSVTVRGEISNVKQSSRGHWYFTLKDEDASIGGVVWASTARRMAFTLEDGMEVFATGELDIYAPSGSYSLVCKKLEPVGVGALQLAFEQIKAKLAEEGLFDPSHKKPIPFFPMRIGMVTSRSGAVIHDMLRVLRRKNPLVNVLLRAVPVQGEGAAVAIAQAIRELNRPEYQLDVMIVGRGGGSFEDLFCFSEEVVARAVFEASVPIITGVGHEPDFSIADAVSDYSASTPTAAAEAAVPDIDQLKLWVLECASQLKTLLQHQLLLAEQRFDRLATGFVETMLNKLNQAGLKLEMQSEQMVLYVEKVLSDAAHRISSWAEGLDNLSPLKTLSRGYSVASTADGKVITQASQVKAKDLIRVTVAQGAINCEVQSCDSSHYPAE